MRNNKIAIAQTMAQLMVTNHIKVKSMKNDNAVLLQNGAMASDEGSTLLNAMIRSPIIKPVVIMFSVMVLLLTGCASIPDKAVENESNLDSLALFQTRQQAQSAYQQSRWIEAVRLYQQVVTQIPSDADAWFRLGNTYAQQGVYQRAIHAYQQSLNHDGEQPKVWFNLSTAYLLNAQSAMRGAHARLRPADPAKQLIAERLNWLDNLVHGRFEESVAPTALSR